MKLSPFRCSRNFGWRAVRRTCSAGTKVPGAHFPKFVLHRSTYLRELRKVMLRKVMGTRRLIGPSTALSIWSPCRTAACGAGTSDLRF